MNYLKGKKVLVTIQELENEEHRGISSYSKSLLKALKKADAEVWLLIGMDYRKIKFNNKNLINKLLITFSLDYLNEKNKFKKLPIFNLSTKYLFILRLLFSKKLLIEEIL